MQTDELAIVIPVGKDGHDIAIEGINSILQKLSQPKRLYVITDSLNFDQLKKISDKIIFLDENKILEGLTLDSVKEYFKSRRLTTDRAGWYFQQFLKMAFSFYKDPGNYYLIWDSNSILLKNIEVFSSAGKMLLNCSEEYNKPYFETINRLLGFGKIRRESFIAEYMLIKKSIMQELISKISGISEEWWINILNSISKTDIEGPAFSEYETYGTYLARYYSEIYTINRLQKIRCNRKDFLLPISNFQFSELSKSYYYITIENNRKFNTPYKKLIRHYEKHGSRKPQITIKVFGGLGNQLWQYAAALALQESCRKRGENTPIQADISLYRKAPKDRPFLLTKLFPKLKTVAFSPEKHMDYFEKTASLFDEAFLSLPPAVTLDGCFQHKKYFESAKKVLKPKLKPLPQKYQELQKTEELVALHVRRKDYTENNLENIHGLLPVAYYQKTLQLLREQAQNPHILIFSEDEAFGRENIAPLCQELALPYSFPKEDAVGDFSTMVQCKHFVLANSSYSQMAALLGEKKDSLVFMPTMQKLDQNIHCRDYLPSHWQQLSYPFYKGSPPLPKVSIIIPVYNTRNYLERCMESACLQSESDIEIIVVDDASSDDCWDLIQSYARRDSRIVPLRQEQSKHAGNMRNTGIEASRGKWLLFLDSNNYISRNTVEVFLRKISACPQAELLLCNTVLVHDGEFSNFDEDFGNEELLNRPFEHYCLARQPSFYHCSWGYLCRRELFVQSGIRFPELLPAQDFTTIPQLLHYMQSRGTVVPFLPEQLFYCQYRASSPEQRSYLQYRVGSQNNSRNKIAIYNFARAVNILDSWGKTLEASEEQLLRHRVNKEIDWWFDHYSEDRKLLTELVANLSADHITQNILQTREQERNLRNAPWYRFKRYSRKQKLRVICKVLSKKMGLYKFFLLLERKIKARLWL